MITPTNMFHDHGASGDPKRMLSYDPTTCTPLVKFNARTGALIIKGLFVESTNTPLNNSLSILIQEYFQENDKLTCYFLFREMNWITTQSLFSVFRILKWYQNRGKEIRVNWFTPWKNKIMLETGHDFSELFDIPLSVYSV